MRGNLKFKLSLISASFLGLASCTEIEPVPQCFPRVSYSQKFEIAAGQELAAMKRANPQSKIVQMINDYRKLYDLDAACQVVAGPENNSNGNSDEAGK